MRDLKVDKNSLKNKLREMGINSLSESSRLGEVYIMLSLECNLRCKVCAWWGIKGPCRKSGFLRKYTPALSIKQFRSFVDEVASFNPRTVTFSGGEPLFYKKWHILAKYFKKKDIKVSLTTNGVLLADNFDKIAGTVDEINLSLGGPPSILSLIRENPPSHFQQILKGLKKITSYKKNNSNLPNLRILYTISDLSYSHMEELITYMRNKKIKIDRYHFQHLMFINEKTFKQQEKIFTNNFKITNLDLWEGYTYPSSKFNFSRFKQEIDRVAKLPNVSFSPEFYPEELKSYYQHDREGIHYGRYCTAPWHQINLMPGGDIYICHDYFIGNIKKQTFRKIWNGPRVKKLRGYLTKKLFPGCQGCFYYYCDRKS